ncbi:hypothetical protein G9464_13870 [Halostella sp. JP-L12]|uniref:HalOD1 output domain-containing protein n=1 Tax=Halostella TaxID=1843185 RepID=UPI000EF844AE|nr:MULTISPECIES: HalOD1 output domain-containing protein [Halostella]NHN48674.1 hypothetical protein [Halostella sp. JP-L12]
MTDANAEDTLTGQNVHIVRHDWGEDDSLSATVVTAVAAVRDLEPTSVDALNETVDPDALNALFADSYGGNSRDGATLSFRLNGCDVTVHGDGRVVVRAPDEE